MVAPTKPYNAGLGKAMAPGFKAKRHGKRPTHGGSTLGRTDMSQTDRLFRKAVNDWVATNIAKPASFEASSPAVINVIKSNGTFGSHALVGGEFLTFMGVRVDGTLIFKPKFVASFGEIHMGDVTALELLTGFMPFWTRLEEHLKASVDSELAKHTRDSKAAAMIDAKKEFPEYGTW